MVGFNGVDDVISIHSPRVGRDMKPSNGGQEVKFQSTLPAWGETAFNVSYTDLKQNFNPLSPRGERLQSQQTKPLPI